MVFSHVCMSVYTFIAHMKLRACELPAPNMRWPLPPSDGVMRPTIAIAQYVSFGRHDHSYGGYSVGHMSGDKFDTRGCEQNSYISMNLHFDIPEYQIPLDSDDDRFYCESGCLFAGVLLPSPAPIQHVCSHTNSVCHKWRLVAHASLLQFP